MRGLEELVRRAHTDDLERRYHSIVTAKVTGIQDDGLYQVQFLVSGDPDQDPDAVHPDVRVMGMAAGRTRGAYFMPEVGDEVVVAFEDGDPNQPIILGGVWNSQAKPPGQARQSTENDVRTIVSRSGHELTFDDRPGGARVVLKSRGGPEVVLDGNTATVHSGAAQITVGPNGVVTIAATTIVLDGGTVAVRGALTINGAPYAMHIHTGGTITPPGVTGPVKGIP